MGLLRLLPGQKATVSQLTAWSQQDLKTPSDHAISVTGKLAKWKDVHPDDSESDSWSTSLSRRVPRGSSFFDDKIALVPVPAGEGGQMLGRGRFERLFNIFMAVVVLLNTVVLAFETDFGPKKDAGFEEVGGWLIVETTFTCIYLFELSVRFSIERWNWFRSWWNYLDLLLAIAALTDLIMTICKSNAATLGMLSMLRLARLSRFVRMLKLLRVVQGFYVVMMGAYHALCSMMWVSVAMIVGLFIFSIVATQTIGHDEDLADLRLGGDSVDARFGNLPRSMYSLFELVTLEGLEAVARPLVMAKPSLVFFFMAFIIIFPFGLLNMIVGLVIEKTLEQQKAMKDVDRQNLHDSLVNDLLKLKQFFEEADTDGDGTLTYEEFEARIPSAKHLLKSVGIRMKDAKELYQILDWHGQGSLRVQEFLEGIARALGVTSHNCQGIATHAGVRSLLRHSHVVVEKLDDLAANHVELQAQVNACLGRQVRVEELETFIHNQRRWQDQVLQKLESLENRMKNSGLMSSASSIRNVHRIAALDSSTLPGGEALAALPCLDPGHDEETSGRRTHSFARSQSS